MVASVGAGHLCLAITVLLLLPKYLACYTHSSCTFGLVVQRTRWHRGVGPWFEVDRPNAHIYTSKTLCLYRTERAAYPRTTWRSEHPPLELYELQRHLFDVETSNMQAAAVPIGAAVAPTATTAVVIIEASSSSHSPAVNTDLNLQ